MEAFRPGLYVFDACALLNLLASRRFVDIANGLSAKMITSALAAGEVLYVRRGGVGPDAAEREPVDLGPLQQAGLLIVQALETPDEVATFVDLALEMDDGEAASCALAIHRGGALVTDDRRAQQVLSRRSPATQVWTTSQVIKAWADGVTLKTPDLARLLLDVETRASFRPGRQDPLRTWWEAGRRLS